MLDDVKRVEENPQRVRGICKPSVSERVRRQQVAELVVNLGLGHRHPRQERHTREDRGRADGRYSEPFFSRELREYSLDPSQDWLTQPWPGPNKQQTNRKKNPEYERHGRSSHIPQKMRCYFECFSLQLASGAA
jgi:hypothetical protein